MSQYSGMGILRNFAKFCGILLNFAQIRIHILIDLSFPQNFEFLFYNHITFSGCKMLDNGS